MFTGVREIHIKQKYTMQQNMIFNKSGKPKRIVDGRVVDYGDGE